MPLTFKTVSESETVVNTPRLQINLLLFMWMHTVAKVYEYFALIVTKVAFIWNHNLYVNMMTLSNGNIFRVTGPL